MGLFDEIRCKVALPVELDRDHRGHWFQTKSLQCAMDNFEIREDGALWAERYDTEDHSDPNATGLDRLRGMHAKVNQRWEPIVDFTGEVVFYSQASAVGKEDDGRKNSGWIEFSAYFIKGQMKHLELLEYTEPTKESVT